MRPLDSLSIGLVLLDRHQHPLIVNARARALAALNDGFSIGQKGLRTARSAATTELQTMIATASDPACLPSRNLCLRVVRPSGSGAFSLRIAPVRPLEGFLFSGPQAAAAVFIDTDDVERLHTGALRAWFQLTAREAELASLLAGGRDLTECATTMGIGFETARTHLTGLFTKTHTRRQAELVSVLLRTAWRL